MEYLPVSAWKMNDQLVLFDLDGTLFDTHLFTTLLQDKISKLLDIPLIDIQKSYQQYKSTLVIGSDFNYDEFIKVLSVKFSVSPNTLKSILWQIISDNDLLFPDVKPTLTKLSKLKFKLGIFSEGFIDTQYFKLNNQRLIEYFLPEYIYVYRRKTSLDSFNSLPSKTTIVDDKVDIIKALTPLSHVLPIYINRNLTLLPPSNSTNCTT